MDCCTLLYIFGYPLPLYLQYCLKQCCCLLPRILNDNNKWQKPQRLSHHYMNKFHFRKQLPAQWWYSFARRCSFEVGNSFLRLHFARSRKYCLYYCCCFLKKIPTETVEVQP